MKCPFCNAADTRVIDSRPADDNASIRRRRQCETCGKRFTTKGISAATQWAIAKAYDGTWDEIGGVGTSLGAAEDATGLPVETWSLTGYSVEEYQQQLADVVSGAIVIDDQVIEGDGITAVEFSNVNLHYE